MVVRMAGRSPTGGVGYAPTTMPPQKGGSDFSSVYDLLPTPASLWSVARRLRRAYTGPVIRVRRSSDNVEQDFYGSGASGLVSPDAIRSFNGWNLVQRTEDFNTTWSKEGVTVSTDATAAPNGTLTADKLVEDSATSLHRVSQTSTATTATIGQNYCASFSVKAAERGFAFVGISGAAIGNVFIAVNLSSGAVSTATGTPAASGAVSEGNGWWRVYVSAAATSAAAVSCDIRVSTDGVWANRSYLGDGASGIFVWGAQVEAATVPTTYEPRTTTGAGSSFLVTRYDQSGNARHATQATTTLQPIVCESGVPVTNSGGRLTSKHVAADARRLAVASSQAFYNFLHTTGGTVLAVSQANDTAGTKAIVRNNSSSSSAGFGLQRTAAEQINAFTGRLNVAGVATAGNSVSGTTTDAANALNSISFIQLDPDNGTASSRLFVYENGTAKTAVNSESGTPFVENAQNELTIGSASGGGNPFDGTIGDIGIWEGFLTEAQRKLVEADQGRFNSITVAP